MGTLSVPGPDVGAHGVEVVMRAGCGSVTCESLSPPCVQEGGEQRRRAGPLPVCGIRRSLRRFSANSGSEESVRKAEKGLRLSLQRLASGHSPAATRGPRPACELFLWVWRLVCVVIRTKPRASCLPGKHSVTGPPPAQAKSLEEPLTAAWHGSGSSAAGPLTAPLFRLQFFHYSQGQVYLGNYPPFKDRISWAGDLDKRDASINIENMQFIHNGTYICDVKNPPDIVVQPGHIRLHVVEKGTCPSASRVAAGLCPGFPGNTSYLQEWLEGGLSPAAVLPLWT